MAENEIKAKKKTLAKKTTQKKVVKKVVPKKVTKKVTKNLGTTEKKKASRIWRKALKKKVVSKRPLTMKDEAYDMSYYASLKLEKHINNPIISPDETLLWERRGTFNPGALYDNGKVHLVYRALTHEDKSVLGYISSDDGINFDLSTKEMCYSIKEEPIKKKGKKIKHDSGGGMGGGSEDPRIIKIENRVYIMFNIFNGWGPERVAMSSIDIEDFRAKRWNWTEAVYLSPPGQRNKNWLLFPEKFDGKFAIIHSISLKIMIECFDDLNYFDGDNFIYSIHDRSPLWELRNKLIRGVGPTPVWTPKGWLIFYHRMDAKEPNKYKIFAMLLDLNDPTVIIAKSKHAVIEPDQAYEATGIHSGIVYACGAVVIDDMIYVYYGAADRHVCLATTGYTQFVDDLISKSDVIIGTHRDIKNANLF